MGVKRIRISKNIFRTLNLVIVSGSGDFIPLVIKLLNIDSRFMVLKVPEIFYIDRFRKKVSH